MEYELSGETSPNGFLYCDYIGFSEHVITSIEKEFQSIVEEIGLPFSEAKIFQARSKIHDLFQRFYAMLPSLDAPIMYSPCDNYVREDLTSLDSHLPTGYFAGMDVCCQKEFDLHERFYVTDERKDGSWTTNFCYHRGFYRIEGTLTMY